MFLKNLIWRFQSGKRILIGKDNFLCGTEEICVPESLLIFLHRKGIFFCDGLIARWQGSIPIWCDAESLQMPADIAMSWDHIRSRLRNCGIFRSSEHDGLIWRNSNGVGSIRVKDIYLNLISNRQYSSDSSFPCIFWKSGCPSKIVLFAWLSFHNKNLSWENLKKRGWQGPGICPICRSVKEENFHLFLNCKGSHQIWLLLENYFGIQHMSHSSIMEAFIWCSKQSASWRFIFIITFWCIWKWRNNYIFNDKRVSMMEFSPP